MERADSLDDVERVVAWLYRIHRNVIIDTNRRLGREHDAIAALGAVPEASEQPGDDPCGCSVSLARGMNPSYASILSMVDSDGLTLGEAARRLDITANNAAVRLHRARKALRQEMLEHCGVRSPRDCADCRCVYEACCAA